MTLILSEFPSWDNCVHSGKHDENRRVVSTVSVPRQMVLSVFELKVSRGLSAFGSFGGEDEV